MLIYRTRGYLGQISQDDDEEMPCQSKERTRKINKLNVQVSLNSTCALCGKLIFFSQNLLSACT